MCGIFGYIGNRQAKSVILEGLRKLEYRGYDSAGLSVLFSNNINTDKCIGQSDNLLNGIELRGAIGIGHTRWATHGKPSLINAHPHNSSDGAFSVVHNGIIENFIELKIELEEKGYNFISDTDSEVIPALLQVYFNGNVMDTVKKVANRIRGNFAIAMVSKYENKIYAFKIGSPVIVGVGEEGKYVSSDVYALSGVADSYYFLNDKEIAILSDHITIYNFLGDKLRFNYEPMKIKVQPYDKNGYEHFMIKEINEQPYIIEENFCEFDRIKNELSDLKFKNIYIIGCGSAYNAGLIGGYFFENICKIKTKCIVASEYIDNCSIISSNDLVIAISQSGETADVLSAVRQIKQIGCKILSITNAEKSNLEFLSDITIYTKAGKEVSVATTKCYTMQCLMLMMLANHFINGNSININHLKNSITKAIASDVSCVIKKIEHSSNVMFIGKGVDYYTVLEGVLKLKEVSYINAQAYPSGELKHGSIALVDEKTLVILVCTDKRHVNKNISAAKEVGARGAYVVGIVNSECDELNDVCDCLIKVDSVDAITNSLLSVIPLQLIAYYSGKNKNIDVDKPKNLAKSVTVE